MKNRDKWITIAFLVFILVIPLVTVALAPMPNIALIYRNAFPIPVERKITHPMMTSTIV